MMRVAFAVVVLALVLMSAAQAQERQHHHPTEVVTGAVALFYETWSMPDRPTVSCCSRKDCYATQAREIAGKVQAMHRESGQWLDVPPHKIEKNRDSPDGRSHLCASPWRDVLCFVAGVGG